MTDYANKKWLRQNRTRNIVLLIIAALVIGIGMSVAAKGATAEPEVVTDETLALLSGSPKSEVEQRAIETLTLKICIEDVAEQNGSPDSDRYARAAMNSRFPRLITGIGVAEKGRFDPAGKRGARGEKGFSQIYEPEWGPVGDTIEEQVEKTDEILAELLVASNGNEEVALRRYNAGTRWKCKDAERYARVAMAVVEGL